MEQSTHDFNSPGPEMPLSNQSTGTKRSRRPQERPRPSKTCLWCRKKKLKCDRLVPCRQCIMRNVQCIYDHEKHSSLGARIAEESDVEREQRRRKVPIPPLHREVRTHAGVPAEVPSRIPSTPEKGNRESTRLIENLQSQVNRLERLTANQSYITNEAPQLSSLYANHGDGPMTNSGTLNVKGSRSRFHGRNQRRSLLKEVSALVRVHVIGLCNLLTISVR